MSTKIRDKVSIKNPYYIPMERELELKWFCRQYSSWQKELLELSYPQYQKASDERVEIKRLPNQNSIVEDIVIRKEILSKKIKMVEDTVTKTDPTIYAWLLEGVTKDVGYDYLRTRKNIPMCRVTYYQRYRKFFYLLDQVRDFA